MTATRENESELPQATGVGWLNSALIAYGRGFEHPFKIRIVRALARLLAANRILLRYAPGAVIEVDPADYIGWALFKTGFYERASLGLALRLMRNEPGLFVDVGANIGLYTCAVAAIAGSSVISIEPDCEACASLRRNVLLNNRPDVAIFTGAAGPGFETVKTLRRAAKNSGTVAVMGREAGGKLGGNWVTTTPLEKLLGQIVHTPVRPVLMKIDVEGFEREVLSGLDFSGPFRPKNILMEFVGDFNGWGSIRDVQEFFAARNYRVYDVAGRTLQDIHELPEANLWAQDHAI